ncbi:uncharacterized protein G2W53_028533 [Senna tora]|uniref:Uncharacterized protein n=1 Tax=Senna tora TaxID=362788 RepID=A0A834WEW1_9FABA|nr:uncharacterized protein G2W53_028533 [Senna tora]
MRQKIPLMVLLYSSEGKVKRLRMVREGPRGWSKVL